MNRYYIDGWASDALLRYPLHDIKTILRNLNDVIPHVLEWLVAMEIDHHFTVEDYLNETGRTGTRRVYMIIPSDDDAFALKMAWNIMPSPRIIPADEDEPYMALMYRL